MVVRRRIGPGGLLELRLALGDDQAGRDVRVTIEPADRKGTMTPEKWRAGTLALGGSWQGEFEIPALGTYSIFRVTAEDCLDETSNLDEALHIALELAKEGQAGEPISIEHDRRVIRQFVLTPDGDVDEESI